MDESYYFKDYSIYNYFFLKYTKCSMTEQDKNTIDKVLATLKKEMESWFTTKRTGQLQLELNYSCGGLSKIYLTTKNSIK